MPRLTLRNLGLNNAPPGTVVSPGVEVQVVNQEAVERIAGELRIGQDAARELYLSAARGDRAKVRAEIDRVAGSRTALERGAFHRIMAMVPR